MDQGTWSPVGLAFRQQNLIKAGGLSAMGRGGQSTQI